MRVCKFMFLCFYVFMFAFAGYAYANKCGENTSACILKEDDNYYFYKNNGSKTLLQEDDDGESMRESFYFYGSDNRFFVVYDSYGFSKLHSETSFNSDFTEVYTLEMQIGFNRNAEYPDNVYLDSQLCYISNIDMSKSEEISSQSLIGLACSSPYLLNRAKINYKMVGNDLFFDMYYEHNEREASMIKLVAFDFLPYLSRSLIACIENCSHIKNKRIYLGKLHTYPITMFIRYEGDSVSGKYYYEKYRQDIKFEGTRQGDELTLFVKNEQGEVTEKFIGVLNDGSFAGQWFNMKNKEVIKTLAFQTYVMFSTN